ncbi:peroxiredoxin [Algoriphagus sp. 4150]|uniref:peroxiredoxin family protein n=1 Tax=Algoriphagus sp. 4150 TaxID=2817756 RepID=UPI002866C360|nr:redoxin domain-containing protein [Algoriphagus sp. 4150]MDR7129284.1 peroxiredoxin [Algoriphagus sp. 4150]
MKKTHVIILVTVLLGSVAYLGYSSQEDQEVTAAAVATPATLPDFPLNDINGESYSIHRLTENTPTLVIYFNSTCHLCQEELNALSKRIEEFKEYAIVLVTVEPVDEMLGFAIGLGIKDRANVHFLLDSRMDLASFYQIKNVPSIYCYNSQKQLVAEYVGNAKMDVLLKKLKGD